MTEDGTPKVLAMSEAPRGPRRPHLKGLDLALILSIDGQTPAGRVSALGRLGYTPARAAQRLAELRKRAIIKMITVYDPARTGAPWQSTVKISVDWNRLGPIPEWESELRDDPAVLDAVLMSGDIDYLLTVAHGSRAAASAWAQDLQKRPGVTVLRMDPVTPLMRRFDIAAALHLDSDAGVRGKA